MKKILAAFTFCLAILSPSAHATDDVGSALLQALAALSPVGVQVTAGEYLDSWFNSEEPLDQFAERAEASLKVMSGIGNKAMVLASRVAEKSMTLYAILSILALTIAGIKVIAGDNVLDVFVDAAIPIILVGAFLSNYSQLVTVGANGFMQSIYETIYAIQGSVPGSAMPSSPEAFISKFIRDMFDQVFIVINVSFKSFTSFTGALLALFVAGPVIYGFIKAGGKLFALWALPSLLAALATIVGPLFLAFAAFQYTRQMFWSWVGVFMGTYGVKIILVACFYLIGSIQALVNDAVIDTNTYSIGDLLMLALYVELLDELFSMLPSMASTLFGGFAGLSLMGSRSGNIMGGSAQKATGLVSKMPNPIKGKVLPTAPKKP